MIHLRLIVPTGLVTSVFQHLAGSPGVAHIAHVSPASVSPPGELLLCDIAREAANDIIEWLQQQDVHHTGAITIEALEGVVSDAAERATGAAPGHAADALIWEELEARARTDAALTASFLVFIGIAAVIAGVGILLDSPILIVGAMAVGPEYGPLSAVCVAAVRGRAAPAARALATLGIGLAVAAAASLAATVVFRTAGLGPDRYILSDRELTAFISHPNGMAAVVAVLAGVVGMLSLTEARSGALIGVLVSVTTIPAAANAGVATAYGEWSEVGGSAVQLGINVTGLIVAGLVTLAVQSRATTSIRRAGTQPRSR
jgi:uncharacterized hydrophobic protein (TIGR00271 family)